jgi:hypothetical protein
VLNACWQMNKDKGGENCSSVPKIADRSREGDIFPVASLDEYAEEAREEDNSDEEDREFVED